MKAISLAPLTVSGLLWSGLFVSGVLLSPTADAQATATVCVTDEQGRALPKARISRGALPPEAGTTEPTEVQTSENGCATVSVASGGYARGVMSAVREGFAQVTVDQPMPGTTVRVVLHPENVQQSVTVTADRGLPGVDDRANDIAVLDRAQLAAPPALALDDRLHQVAGFQLYRRTSSWTANPTTEGVSLRGLGSTAASRTLVVSDQVPLNDPFGGWIHWDEIPTLAIADVQVVRGGAADLYGSSAIGGVIDIEPVVPVAAFGVGKGVQVSADAFGATENSASGDFLLTAGTPLAGLLLAGSGVNTGGYTPTAPSARGSVDIPADVAEESGRVELRSPARPDGDGFFLRGNVLNEARGNGTPLQTNGTRLWRYLAGGDANTAFGHGALRVFGDREVYRQSFSAIAANRNAETLTRLQRVPTDEFGSSLSGSHAFPHALAAAVGLDLRDVRATDAESPVSQGAATSTTDISAHQRELGGYAEGIWQPRHWSLAASVRVDSFRTFDGRQSTASARAMTREPEVNELVASPHAGIVRELPHGLALTASGFRAFRGPTMNELYRTGQVGQQTTMANPSLLAERATGFELGGEFTALRLGGRNVGHLRASYFWTQVNRPVAAVVLAQTATTQTLERQNLGQIRSRGLSLEAGTVSWRNLDFGFGYQLAFATVTAFNTSSLAQANLTGKWIPEVPRELVTATANYAVPRVAAFHIIASYTGRAYDDAANQFLLHAYPRLDVSADRAISGRVFRGLSVYAGVQNVANRTIEAGRTPVLTLAAPRLVQMGLRYRLGQ